MYSLAPNGPSSTEASRYSRPRWTTGRISLYTAISSAASASSASVQRSRSPPTPSAPAIATWNRKLSGSSRPVRKLGLSVTQAAHDLRRVRLGEALLDLDPVPGVGVVRGPDLLDPPEDAQVDPAAAAGAGFEVDARVGGAQPVDDRVEAAHVVGPDAFRVAAGLRGPARLGERPVHVPLDELDVVLRQQAVQRREHPVRHVGPGQVQHQLVAVLRPGAAGEVVHPVRVRPVEVAVRVHHLRLDPQPEPHAEVVDPADERAEAARELLPVDRPVAQSRPVVVAARRTSRRPSRSTRCRAARPARPAAPARPRSPGTRWPPRSCTGPGAAAAGPMSADATAARGAGGGRDSGGSGRGDRPRARGRGPAARRAIRGWPRRSRRPCAARRTAAGPVRRPAARR